MNRLLTAPSRAEPSAATPAAPVLQRQCACGTHTPSGGACGSCAARKHRLQRRAAFGAEPEAAVAPLMVHEVLRRPGRPLDEATRAFFEPRFGHDFSRVRVHTDAQAAESAAAVNALAYTIGYDVVFNTGRHAPYTSEGRHLLAHELTHVIQQSGTDGRRPPLQRQAVPTEGTSEEAVVPVTEEDREKDEAPPAGTSESSTDETIGASNEALEEELLTNPISTSASFDGGGTLDALEKEANAQAHAIETGGRAVVRLRASGRQIIQLYTPTICGRPSTQFPDFPTTYIDEINVDITSPDHPVALTWRGPNAGRAETGPFHSSPGAGTCGLNCDNASQSQQDGSHCTPKGTRTVDGYACALSTDSRATNATFFHRTRGIALHYFPSVPTYPASHGCVRLADLNVARLIYDNSRSDVTTVNVTGTWTRGRRGRRPVCY